MGLHSNRLSLNNRDHEWCLKHIFSCQMSIQPWRMTDGRHKRLKIARLLSRYKIMAGRKKGWHDMMMAKLWRLWWHGLLWLDITCALAFSFVSYEAKPAVERTRSEQWESCQPATCNSLTWPLLWRWVVVKFTLPHVRRTIGSFFC